MRWSRRARCGFGDDSVEVKVDERPRNNARGQEEWVSYLSLADSLEVGLAASSNKFRRLETRASLVAGRRLVRACRAASQLVKKSNMLPWQHAWVGMETTDS